MPELSVRGRRVAYLDQGGGVPVVLLHAGGSSSKHMSPLSHPELIAEAVREHVAATAPAPR